MDIARTQNYLIIFVLLSRKHGIISNTKPVIQGCIFNGIHSDWIGELQKDDFEKLKNLADQLIQQEGSEEKALASLDARLENDYRNELKAIEIRFHELLKDRIGFLLVNSSNWVGVIAPQIGLNLTSLALIDVNSGWSALPFTSLSWTITDRNGIVTLSYRDNCRMADGWGRGFDITSDSTKLTYEESVQPYDSNPISAEKESQIANTTKWGNRPIGLILSLFGIFILFGTLGVPLYLAYSGEKEIQLFVKFNLMGGSLFLLGMNLLLFGNYKWFPKNLGQENIGNLHWQQALQQVWFRIITLHWQVWCLIYANIFIAAIAFVYIQGVFESFGFEGLKQENQPKAEIITKAIAEAKTNEIPLTGEQKADLEKALTINNQLNTLFNQRKYAEATPLAIEALKIRREIFGNKHPDTARSIKNLALLYEKQAQYAKAEPLYLEALKIFREVFGDKHPDTAISINNLAGLYNVQAQYAKAEPLYLEALKIQREVFGDKHPDTATCINSLAQLYSDQGQYANAEPLFLEALKILKEIRVYKHPITAHSINGLANIYLYQSLYAKAEPLYLEALKIRREVQGDKHHDTAASIHNLGLLYNAQAQYAKAEPLYLEALKINMEVLGNKHSHTATSISMLAGNYSDQAQYAKAEPLYLEALKIRREALGDKHPYTATSMQNLAEIYRKQAQYAKAEPLYLEALKINREVLGDKHPNTATSIRSLALLYFEQAQYAKAEPLYLEALKIYREVLGDKHPNTAGNIFNLANIYTIQAQYAKAEPLYLEALKIRREILGDKHDDTATSINNLAMLYEKQAQYAKAEPLYLEALKINREVLGNNHPSTAMSINNLANIYCNQAQYAKAEPLYLEALKIYREVLGDKHPNTATSINNLAGLYNVQAQYAKAEPLYLEALKIFREVLGDNHHATALSINNLALVYGMQAQYAKAEPLCLEALKIFREVLGDKHPDTARAIINLGFLYESQAQYAKAEPLYLEALKINTDHLQATATIQSENVQILMANNKKFFLNQFLTNAIANDSPGGGYDQVLSWKGMIYRRQNLLRALQGNDPLKKELSDTIRQLATILNSNPKPGEEQVFQDKVKNLSEKKEELEKELAKQIPSLNLAKVTPPDLQNIIALDAALVDIFQYWHSSPPKEDQREQVSEDRYAAWVIRKDKPIIRLELGSAEDINNLVFQWRSSLSIRKSPSEGPQDPAMALREKVWLPIAKHLDGAKTVIISPDGALGTLPFTALPGEDIKKYLIEERNIAVVPFLQTLPDLLAKKESTSIASMLALGDVAYDVEATSPSITSSLLAVRGEKGAKWNRLPGTKAEVLSIEDSFKKYFPSGSMVELNQNKASEQSVRESAPKSRYLHFATHGFFADETVKAMSVKQDDNKRMMGEKVVVTGENPGLLSGLVLAGANLPPKGNGDDGILTASEVAELDLTGVELAILSACETGLGKTAGGEGIFGLQRAFQLAGARTVVASSWKVPDLSTKELMVRFYGNLWEKKMGKLEALREAQLWVMKEGKAAGLDRGIDDESVVVKDTKKEPTKVEGTTKGEMLPPKYWAAWILSGAWN